MEYEICSDELSKLQKKIEETESKINDLQQDAIPIVFGLSYLFLIIYMFMFENKFLVVQAILSTVGIYLFYNVSQLKRKIYQLRKEIGEVESSRMENKK